MGLAAREDFLTPAASMREPPMEPTAVWPPPAAAAAAAARLACPAGPAPATALPSMPMHPAMRRLSHWLLFDVVVRLNAVRNVSCSSRWPMACSSRSRPASSVDRKHATHAARARSSASLSGGEGFAAAAAAVVGLPAEEFSATFR